MNYIIITGNLGNDPVLKFSKDNKALASFSLAVGQRVKENGEWIDAKTMWFQVKFFGVPAEKVVDRYKKGDTVTVSGRLEESFYTAKDGEEKSSKDIFAFDINKVERYTKLENVDPAGTDKAPF